MKNIQKITALLAITLLWIAVTPAGAASRIKPEQYPVVSTLVYERSLNPAIGITADYAAVGSTYTITDGAGRKIMTGTIRSGRTFYIPTSKLGNGVYRFQIGGQVLQQFVIK